MAGGQYPGGLDSFTANVDDVDDVLAADVNELQVGIVAIETELGIDPAGSCTDVKTRLAHSVNDAGLLEFDDCTLLTIATGAITVTQNYHKIDTQGGASSDDLDTINGYSAGLFIILRTVADARDVVIKHNTGNIYCPDGNDITLSATNEFAFGVYDTGQSKWLLARGASSQTPDGSGVANQFAYWYDANTLTSNDILQISIGRLVINEAGDDHDTRIEGASDQNLVYVDAGNDRVGIGDSTPSYKLDVTGDGRYTSGLLVNTGLNDVDSRIAGDTEANLIYVDAGNDRVGIGMAAPAARLHIKQDKSDGAIPVLELDQDDVDDAFVNFVGTSAADQTKSISTVNGDGAVEGPKNFSASAGWAFVGMIRNEINGAVGWVPYYTADTS